ncbi:MAG: SLBB domain-containing protein, partial [Ignavibacteria bacterium]|nr:SLBB domain-containing protein [Ignavibacteria bacterium]
MKYQILFLIFLITSFNVYAQEDSIKFGPIETMKIGANYHNYSDKDKANIEVLVIGGVKNPGVYLIPKGKTLVDLLALTGGAVDESNYESFKFIRTKKLNPDL